LFNFSAKRAFPADQPLWWPQAEIRADRDGYQLISTPALHALYRKGGDFLVVDTRTDYEYKAGHLPRAVQIKFDPGEKYHIKAQKKAAFEKVLGPEKNRLIIIYCRNHN
jgi:rhodanese-related sulfurtransferase